MRTREIRERIRTIGFERGVVYCLEAQNEKLAQLETDLREVGVYMNKIVDTITGMTAVAERMKETVERLNMREGPAHPELGDSTNALDKE